MLSEQSIRLERTLVNLASVVKIVLGKYLDIFVERPVYDETGSARVSISYLRRLMGQERHLSLECPTALVTPKVSEITQADWALGKVDVTEQGSELASERCFSAAHDPADGNHARARVLPVSPLSAWASRPAHSPSGIRRCLQMARRAAGFGARSPLLKMRDDRAIESGSLLGQLLLRQSDGFSIGPCQAHRVGAGILCAHGAQSDSGSSLSRSMYLCSIVYY